MVILYYSGGKWTVVAHSSDAAAAMYRAEGKCPSRGRLFEESFKWIHKKNKWPVPMAFAYVTSITYRLLNQYTGILVI